LLLSQHEDLSLINATELGIERKEEWGGNLEYTKYEDLVEAFKSEALHPGDLKNGVEKNLNALLQPIREIFESPENVKLVAEAYPPPVKEKYAKQKQQQQQ